MRIPDQEIKEKAISSIEKSLFFGILLNTKTFSILIYCDQHLLVIGKGEPIIAGNIGRDSDISSPCLPAY